MSDSRKTFNFIILLRSIAPLLVIWDHLFATWLDRRDMTVLPLVLVRRYVTEPLHIVANFGFFAVIIFFLIAGFLVTYIVQYENRSEFLTKRILRIFPPLIVATLIAFFLQAVFGNVTLRGGFGPDLFSLRSFFLNATLLNFFVPPYRMLNVATWALVPIVMFYFLSFAIMPLVRTRPRATLAIGLSLCLFSVLLLPDTISRYVVRVGYLILGQVIYYRWSRTISAGEFMLFSLATFSVLGIGYFGFPHQSFSFGIGFGLSGFYAYMVFITALALEERIKPNRVLSLLSTTSYSLYLNHLIPGALLLVLLQPVIGFLPAFGITLLALIGLSYLLWKYVEVPPRKITKMPSKPSAVDTKKVAKTRTPW